MEQPPFEYEVTPEDLDRIDRVNLLISAHASEFKEAGTAIDREYSAANIAARARAQNDAQSSTAGRSASGGLMPISPAAARIFRLGEIPHAIHRISADGWNAPARRWRVVIHNLVNHKLPVTLPGADWALAAEVLLVHWITCDERAEHGPALTEFQRWAWDPEQSMPRESARCYVNDWPKFNRGVDLALAIAGRRGLSLSPRVTVSDDDKAAAVQATTGLTTLELRAEISGLSDTQRAILRELGTAVQKGDGLTLDELMRRTKASNRSTVERGINGMETLGLEIPNAANGAGYRLRGLSLRVAQELLRIDAESTPKRR